MNRCYALNKNVVQDKVLFAYGSIAKAIVPFKRIAVERFSFKLHI